MRLRVFGALLLGAAFCGVAVGTALALAHRGSTPPHTTSPVLHAQATWRAGARQAPAFRLRDEGGRILDLSSERGRVVLLTFLDSRCRNACPIEGRLLARVQRRLGAGAGAQLLVVSVDPWSDTARSARSFAAEAGWHASWHWLLGTPSQLRPIWKKYAVGVRRTPGDVAHTTVLYVIDPQGFVPALYLVPFRPGDVAADVRELSGL